MLSLPLTMMGCPLSDWLCLFAAREPVSFVFGAVFYGVTAHKHTNKTRLLRWNDWMEWINATVSLYIWYYTERVCHVTVKDTRRSLSESHPSIHAPTADEGRQRLIRFTYAIRHQGFVENLFIKAPTDWLTELTNTTKWLLREYNDRTDKPRWMMLMMMAGRHLGKELGRWKAFISVVALSEKVCFLFFGVTRLLRLIVCDRLRLRFKIVARCVAKCAPDPEWNCGCNNLSKRVFRVMANNVTLSVWF